MKKAIIIANGDKPNKKFIQFLIDEGFNTIFSADGGLDNTIKLNLKPDYIIGDFDSVDKEKLSLFRGKSIIKKIKNQYTSDVEKCLNIAIKKKFDQVVLTGATGGRLDHTINNVGIVLKYYKRILVMILSGNSLLLPLTGKIAIRSKKGEQISFFAFKKNTQIISHGLKYSLDNSCIILGEGESLSNAATSDLINLNIKNGTVIAVRNLQFMIKHDLF